ncbi:PQQ-binding-like beta-propeller repeat protein [Thermoproteota archaeon]
MKILQNKYKLTAIFVITLLMISASGLIANIYAQNLDPDQDLTHGTGPSDAHPGTSGPLPAGVTPTYTFDVEARLAFTPNPIGVDQVFTINLWITPPPSAERFMKDYLVVIQKPDGTTNTVAIDSYVADGTAWFPYLADQVGEWKLQFFFLGQYSPAGWYNDGEYQTERFSGSMYYDSDYYRPTNTPVQTLTVQEEFVYSWPLIDLPTDYWTRPISLEHREWAAIAGNYPPQNLVVTGEWSGNPDYYGPYITAPNTSHVVWKKDVDVGGITGGEAGVYSELAGGSTPDVIYLGRCYDTYYKPGVGNVAGCFDLRTGEIYYEIPTSEGGVTPTWLNYYQTVSGSVPGSGADDPVRVQMLAVDSTSNPETLYKIDPYTGSVNDYDLTNDEGDGPGRILAYYKGEFWSVRDSSDSVVDPYMISHFWNRTSIQDNGYPTYLVKWDALSNTNNFASRVNSNITYRICPSFRGSASSDAGQWNWYGRMGTPDIDAGYTAITRRFFDNAVWGGQSVGVSLTTGEVVWERMWENAPYSPRTTVAEDGVYVVCFNQGEVKGLNIATGEVLWTNTDNSYPFGGFWGYDEAAAYGLAYFWSYDGVQAFDLQTGVERWHYTDPAVKFETTYTGPDGIECNPFNGHGFIADNKVYTRNSEHTATAPYARGWDIMCLDAHTGEELWSLAGPMDIGSAADGYLTATNDYQGQMYVFGKGKSETTVMAPLSGAAKGSAMTITGSVLDISPAQPGTPCVSVDSMDLQMNYIHMQRPIDGLFGGEAIEGVQVILTAYGENGNFVDLGTVTSDGYYGSYGVSWTPEEEGLYKITANFAGSDAYGSSGASTFVTVGPEVSTGGPIEPEPEPTTPFITTEVAIILAVAVIAVIGVAAFWLIKKRK